jgi:hypothetical protein
MHDVIKSFSRFIGFAVFRLLQVKFDLVDTDFLVPAYLVHDLDVILLGHAIHPKSLHQGRRLLQGRHCQAQRYIQLSPILPLLRLLN